MTPHHLLPRLTAGCLLGLAVWQGSPTRLLAQPAPVVAQSHSGQFVVRGAAFAQPLADRFSRQATNLALMTLEPTLVAVSCEHIRQIVWRMLEMPKSQWEGKISIFIRPAATAGPPTLTAVRFREGWRYQIDLPDRLERSRYAQAVVQALLLELANRQSDREHQTEVPLWLSTGLAERLLAANAEEVVLEPPSLSGGKPGLPAIFLNERKANPLQEAHDLLSAHEPLTFEELSWPRPQHAAGEGYAVYRASAQIFVRGLLGLPGGPGCLRKLVTDLPRYHNWQFAFLGAFPNSFQRPLDVEKWWALASAQFSGRAVSQAWTREESWRKLDEALHPGIQVRGGANQLPTRSSVTLQTVILSWDRQAQIQALRPLVAQLGQILLHADTEMTPLAREYQELLARYLEKQEQPAVARIARRGLAPRQLPEATARQLDALDDRRQQLRPALTGEVSHL
jgi:hypothetical protein